MTQIIVTLDNNADSSLLRRMIENMRGVAATSVKTTSSANAKNSTNLWIDEMKQLSEAIDSSVIDLNDERTNYIMGK